MIILRVINSLYIPLHLWLGFSRSSDMVSPGPKYLFKWHPGSVIYINGHLAVASLKFKTVVLGTTDAKLALCTWSEKIRPSIKGIKDPYFPLNYTSLSWSWKNSIWPLTKRMKVKSLSTQSLSSKEVNALGLGPTIKGATPFLNLWSPDTPGSSACKAEIFTLN